MSIFQALQMGAGWTPIVTTIAPMTVTLNTINIAQFGTFGNVCFFAFNITVTMGGVMSAAQISISTPRLIKNFGAGNYPFAAAVPINGGAAAVIGRGIVGATSNTLIISKGGDAGDLAWLAGSTNLNGSGFYMV